jgi:putative ABC transport system substrate-binding protein
MGTQHQAKLPRVGVIANGSPDSLFEAVRQSFAQHGYIEGRNIVIEARFAQGHLDRVPEFIAEFVGLNVDIIVSLGAVGPAAAQKANTKLPVVFVAVIDPVAVGLATTLERPGGNITGITTFDPQQAAKQLELLKQVMPNLARLAILSDEDIPRAEGWNPLEKTNDTAARALGVRPQWLKIKGPIPDLEGAFTAMRNERAEALLVLDVPIPVIHQKRIADLAATYRLPTMFLGGRRMSEAGGLIAYGAGLLDTLPRIPAYVEKILGGAKPGDLPIEVLKQPILIFNLKTARKIGMAISPELLKRADQVIE